MAASAKSRQVSECLALLNSPLKIQKLKTDTSCRESVITMLETKVQKPLLSMASDADILNHSLNAIIASEIVDQEIHALLLRFLQATYFPAESYKKIFHPLQCKNVSDSEPDLKRPKFSTFMDHSHLLSHPKRCKIMANAMYQAYKSELKNQKLSVPFMDLLKLTGLTHLDTLPDITLDHLNLLNDFAMIFAECELTRVGNIRARSSQIFAKATQSLIYALNLKNESILLHEVEHFLVRVFELDPGILKTIMHLIWPYWAKNELLTVMERMSEYLGKSNQPKFIFSPIYSQSRQISRIVKIGSKEMFISS